MKWAVYNPNNLAEEQLPYIYGFNNGGSPGWYTAVALSEDGYGLGSHICSDEYFMCHDLGMYDGTRPDRHEGSYQKHYPNGYRMLFVYSDEAKEHEGLQKALKLARDIYEKEKANGTQDQN